MKGGVPYFSTTGVPLFTVSVKPKKRPTWDEVRAFYSKRKEDWAKTKSYYSGNPEWGIQYGYQLAPPYSVQEVEQSEALMGCTFPDDLRDYLTTVSRELFAGGYPMIFHLPQGDIGSFQVPLDTTLWDYVTCLTHRRFKDCPEDCPDVVECGGYVTVGDGGCTDQDYLIIKGNHLGTIWSDGGGGDSIIKNHYFSSFWDLITSRMTEK